MFTQAFCWLFLWYFCGQGVDTSVIKLTPTQIYAQENSSATITCSKTNGTLQETRWENSQISQDANLAFKDRKCFTTRFLLDSDLFDGVCNDNGTYSVVLKRIDRSQHGAEWMCKEFGDAWSNKVVVHVSVPATSVTLVQRDKDYVMENQPVNFTSITSACRPGPRVQWYLRDSQKKVLYNMTVFSTFAYIDGEYGLKAVQSTLHFQQNRTVNGFYLFSKVFTERDEADITSKEIMVNVTYPPDYKPKIQKPNNNLQVIESDTGTFSCSITGGNPLASLSWNCFGSNDVTSEVINNTVSSTIKWKALKKYSTCSCQAHHLNNWNQMTSVNVNVQYSPAKPNLTIGSTSVFTNVQMIRNNTLEVVCISEGNPFPNYTWSGPSMLDNDGDTLRIGSVKKTDQGLYTCNATNRMTRSNKTYKDGRASSSFNLTILYPPSTPKFRLSSMTGPLLTSHIFKMVKGDTFTIYCDVNGNPDPDVIWDNDNRGHTLKFSNIFVDMNRTCVATNSMKETAKEKRINTTTSGSLTIEVLYPPGIPTINVSNLKNETVQGQEEMVSIIESETISLTCFSQSDPLPTYHWFRSQSPLEQESVVTFQNITRNDADTYICNVKNVMKRSNGTYQDGENKTQTSLNILYPAIVDHMEGESVIEGSHFEKVCPVLKGNPSNSTIVWSRIIDRIRWGNEILYMQNVSRTDDSDYTCSVTTEMYPTIGGYLKIEKERSFHLNVFFKSEIKTFTLNTSSEGKTFVINKTEPAYLICIAEANPASYLTIENARGDYLTSVSNSNIARHTIHNTSCVNAGEYTCTGRNNFTTPLPARSFLILIVKCEPKPSSGDTSVVKVATVLHVNVSLHFTARNYLDEPNKTIFSWFRQNDSISDNDSKYMIVTDGLQTSLTVQNASIFDLGIYRVSVKNSIGEYDHYYDVKATDKPDPPTNFKVINSSITDKSATLTWSPGFNGGFQQTFVILYKTKSVSVWMNRSITDTGEKNMNFTLFDLTSMQEYEIEMFAKNREGSSLKTNRLQFKTKEPFTSSAKSATSDKTAIVVGSVSGVICIVVAISILGVVFFLRRRKLKNSDGLYQNVPFIGRASAHNQTKETKGSINKTFNGKMKETTFKETKIHKTNFNNSNTDETTIEDLQEVDDVPVILNERTEYCNSQDEIKKIERITVAELYAYVFGNEDVLEIEYQKLPAGLQKPCTFARKPDNLALNRYNGIYPYDHSRVKIPEQPDFFINACYIDGYKRKKTYIASLGPTSKTTSDFKTFWQMIWHEQSDLIVMLTNLREISGMKCEQYWPDSGLQLQYGDVLVISKTTEVYAEYTVRTFDMSKGNQQRSLTHLHYTAWPDKTVPEDVTSLLEFRKRMKNVRSTHKGPIVIHCSAGIGRTGTLIALDILIEEGHDIGSVNVFECVKSLRDQRVKMVQTWEQYLYIHKALVNSLFFECETFTRERILDYLSTDNDRQYSSHFQQLKLSVETDNTKEQKERTKNSSNSIKNRQGADIPGDRFRVFLNHTDGRDGSDYINAVYVNSFKQKDHFIIAQSPLQTTVTDFLSMIYHGDCSCIASMEDLKEPGMAVGTYLPEKNKPITFGSYEVSCSKFEDNAICVVRKMKIKYTGKFGSGEKCFYHFQYTKWMTGSKTPGDVTDFVQFVQEVEEYANELGEERSRVVVHCLKANERSCLFCAVAIIIEKLKIEGNVNILNVIRHLRTRRRSAIVSKEQLKFCYEAAGAFVRANRH